MINMFDYLTWRGDLLFKDVPLNEIDNVILSELAYMNFERLTPKFPTTRKENLVGVIDALFTKIKKEDIVMGLIVPHTVVDLTDKIKEYPRFASISVSNYINNIDIEKEIQFSAITFHLDRNTIYVAFRGTDDTLIGWQENLNMLSTFPIPGQIEAAKYLDQVAELFPNCTIYVGGHSKGGNLAQYAGIYCKDEIKERIINVFSNDGPNFKEGSIDQDKYHLIENKFIKIMPESSIIGNLLESVNCKQIVVKSSKKGVNQHDAFSWQVMGTQFIRVKELTTSAIKINDSITSMIEKMDKESRSELTNDVYQFILKTNVETLTSASKNRLSLLKATKGMNMKQVRIFVELIFNVFRYGGL